MGVVTFIPGGVVSAKGFSAAGAAGAIKYEGRNDVALIVADSLARRPLFLPRTK